MFQHVPRIMIVAAAALAFVGAAPTLAHRPEVSVSQAWSRATQKGAKVAGGYLTIDNTGLAADRLLSASSPAAAKVEIHRMSMQDGIMTMRPLGEGLTIPPDTTVTLAPGSDHIMFVGLAARFEEGQRIPVTLTFQRSGKIETALEVGSIGANGPRLQFASEPASTIAAGKPTAGTFAD